MKNDTFDAIVIGAGSIGTPAAMFLGEYGLKVLVLDCAGSPGQGQNKAAIGGVRATHSDGSKVKTCLRSLRIFSSWKEKYDDDIGWRKGGYTFPAYTESDEKMMKDMLSVQKSFGLKIDWVGREEMKKIVPGINAQNLRGGTLSPEDGSASPLLSVNAFHKRAVSLGVKFNFRETVSRVLAEKGKVRGVVTSAGTYHAPFVINAAGADAGEIGAMVKAELPVSPDTHEAGITEPVERFFKPMVVDIRAEEGSKNYYFYQNSEGQIVFCLTPNPPIWGTSRLSTSAFLPMVSRRMISLMPALADIKVRRVWRGLYPMTPDGFPIVDRLKNPEGFIAAAGMCGQGFMLGPGVGELVAKMVTGKTSPVDEEILRGFRLGRTFSGMEKFK